MDGFKNSTRMRPMMEGTSSRPRNAAGRTATDRELGLPSRATPAETRAKIRAEEGAAVARGNRTPYEPIPPAPKRMKTGGLAVMPKGKKC